MKFTGKCKQLRSSIFDEDVVVLEYVSKSSVPYCTCSRCGKPLKKRMFVVQSVNSDIELTYFGAECIDYLS